MHTEILSTHTPELFRLAVDRAAKLLRAGELVALPTETVYGLAANALDPAAVARIFEVKGRPANNPIIVHICDLQMARRCVSHWPELAEKLASAFWPGPMTLVLPRSSTIPDEVTAGGDTVGIRWPSHPFIQAVARACGFPLAAPSANLSMQLSPTNAGHVEAAFNGRIPLIVDGGQSQVGIESTVLDLTVEPMRVLRSGMIHEESLTAAMGGMNKLQSVASNRGRVRNSEPMKSPGMLRKHYSPRARLILCSWVDDDHLRRQLSEFDPAADQIHVIAHTHIPAAADLGRVCVIPHDAEAYARALYAELHRCDQEGAGLIVVEEPPASAEWQGIRDRLERAAAK